MTGAVTGGRPTPRQARRVLWSVSPGLAPWPSAVRRGALMAALLLGGLWVGNPMAGIAATTGALNIALLDAAVPRRVLSRALWLCAFTTAIVGFAAVLVGDSWLLVPLLGVLAYLQGSLAGAGVALANATIASMITAILFSVAPGSAGDAVVLTSWLFLGAFCEVVVALIAWHWERQDLLRRQLGQALVRRVGPDPATADPWRRAATESLRSSQLTGGEREAFDALLEAVPTASADDAVAVRAATRRIRRVGWARWVRPDRSSVVSDRTPARGGDEAGSATAAGTSATRWQGLADALAAADLRPPRQPAISEVAVARNGGSPTRWLTRLGESVRWGSPSGRAGTRLAVLMVFGALVVEWTKLPQGHWVLLVFALAIRPDFEGTVVTLLARGLGVGVGVAGAAAGLLAAQSVPLLLGVATVVSGVLTCRWVEGNATMFFGWLTVFVTILVDVGSPQLQLGAQRVLATVVGICLGLAASLAWPGWRRGERRQQVPATPDPGRASTAEAG